MTPHPEPRIMTTADLRFERVARFHALLIKDLGGRLDALEREDVEIHDRCDMLVKRLDSNRDVVDDVLDRLTALERVQRDAVSVDDVIEHYTATEDEWRRQCQKAQRERDALRAVLLKYPVHPDVCWSRKVDQGVCDCGYAAAIASATPAEGGAG